MQTLRSLPILGKPSRPNSPAPPSTQVTHSTANGITQQVPNGEAKSRSRSLSRQIVDTKAAGVHQLAQSTVPLEANLTGNGMPKRGPSPPNSRTSTPRLPTSTTIPSEATVPSTGAPASAYMDVLGLRLNDVVNKASAGVDYKAKKGFKKGMGWSVGEAVVKELPYPPNDAYLIRAVLRTAVRSLSIFTTRLESILLPALTDPTFATPLNTTGPSSISHPLNPAQHFAVSVAHAAWETCEVLEQTLETNKWPKFVQETLRPVMDKLDLVVGKVTQPLLMALKRDLIHSLNRKEGITPPGGKVNGLPSIPNPLVPGPDVPLKKEPSNQPISRLSKEPSQSGYQRQLPIPTSLQHFASRVDGARKALEIVAGPCADDGEAWITNVIVAVVWKGMCVMSDKDSFMISTNRPPSPGSVHKALNNLGKENSLLPTVVSGEKPTLTTHTSTGGGALAGGIAKLTNPLSILPSRSASRPPSPPKQSRIDPNTHALMSLEGLVKRLVNGLVPPPSVVAPGTVIDPNDTEHLAREALHEALEALQSYRIFSSAMYGQKGSTRILNALKRIRDDIDDPSEDDLDDALEDLPAITLWNVLVRQANISLSSIIIPSSSSTILDEKTDINHFNNGLREIKIKSPAEVWGWNSSEYDVKVLGGFGTAEEWGRRVAGAYKSEIERVGAELSKIVADKLDNLGNGEKLNGEIIECAEWVRSVAVGIEGRSGVKVGVKLEFF